MIRITVRQLRDCVATGAIQRFFAVDKPVRVTFANRKLGKAIDAEVKAYDEQRIALLRQYGTLSDGEKDFVFAEGKRAEFDRAFEELLSQAVDDLPGEPVKFSDLGDGRLSEADLALLEPFLTE